MPPRFGIDQNSAVAVVPGHAQQAGLACAITRQALAESSATVVLARRAMALKISPVAESPASMPVILRVDAALHNAANARNQVRPARDRDDAGGRADDIDDVAFAAAGANRIPVGVKGSDGNRNACLKSKLVRPVGRERPSNLVGGRVVAVKFPADAASSGSTLARNSSGGSPPSAAFHIHLWPMAQTLRFTSLRIGDPAKRGGDHVAVFEARWRNLSRFSGLCRSQCSNLAKPHSEEYTPPHHSIAASFSARRSVIWAASCFARWSHQR